MKKLSVMLIVACLGTALFFAWDVFAQEEGQEENVFEPFYFPYTPESDNWFQPIYHPYDTPDEKPVFSPFISVRQMYDDNIFLTDDDKRDDWITTVNPGFRFEPRLKKHGFYFDYLADLNFYADYDDQNNFNHLANIAGKLDITKKARIDLYDRFSYFSEQSGSEDTNRIDRTQNLGQGNLTFMFNKLDLTLGYENRYEDYRSDDAIGPLNGVPLTYNDLDRVENEGAVEAALKLWKKTALLLTMDYGTIDHDTGNKNDSDYFDFLVGLRGQPTAKCVAEARIGYRDQDYDDFEDFSSVVFDGSIIENFTPRDSLRLDLKRTTNDTIYTDNVYFESTYIGAGYKHGFTERLFGHIGMSYQLNYYPIETTEGDQTDNREDDFWSYGAGITYVFPKNFVAELKYQFRTRDSNFSIYDYENSRINASITGTF
ncbi:MAG: outer membrane beta-barrel protein [Candidatus Omnitrophica bacterium]|nr:outer membrane beta-barrel protein [Candidatus Omnitrophota bacterium]